MWRVDLRLNQATNGVAVWRTVRHAFPLGHAGFHAIAERRQFFDGLAGFKDPLLHHFPNLGTGRMSVVGVAENSLNVVEVKTQLPGRFNKTQTG